LATALNIGKSPHAAMVFQHQPPITNHRHSSTYVSMLARNVTTMSIHHPCLPPGGAAHALPGDRLGQQAPGAAALRCYCRPPTGLAGGGPGAPAPCLAGAGAACRLRCGSLIHEAMLSQWHTWSSDAVSMCSRVGRGQTARTAACCSRLCNRMPPSPSPPPGTG